MKAMYMLRECGWNVYAHTIVLGPIFLSLGWRERFTGNIGCRSADCQWRGVAEDMAGGRCPECGGAIIELV